MLVREDAQLLYGFATVDETAPVPDIAKSQWCWRKDGPGNSLGDDGVTDFERYVQLEDSAMLVKIPGVGKKTAERLIIEMRDKFDKGARLQAGI